MSVEPPRYIYEDYKLWQGDWELIDGYPFAMAPSPYGKHQKLMIRLGQYFNEVLEECDCEVYPELDWIIDESNVVRPDLAVYCEDIETYPTTTPKIVIEIVSASTAKKDETIKYELYEKEAVEYYVLVYPDLEKVRIFKLEDGKYRKVFEGRSSFGFDLCDMKIDFTKAWKK